MAGQAATLQLVRAGPVVGYRHYLAPAELLGRSWPLLVLGAELLAVLAGAWSARERWVPALSRAPWTRIAAIAAVLCALSAFPSREPAAYAIELGIASALQLLHLGAVGLAVLSIPPERARRAGRRLARRQGDDVGGRPRLDRFAVGTAAAVTLVTAGLAVAVYERHPHVPDEVAYLYHARYLARGDLAMEVPPVPEAFDVDLMTYEDDRWFSPVPPGWPAILAIGVAAGAPWLVNPALAGLGVLLAYLLLGSLYGRTVARGGILLLAVSPWYLFLGMSFMNHMGSLVPALAAGWAVGRWRATGGVGWPVLAGVSLGLVGLVRPLEAVIVGLVLLAGMVGGLGRRRALREAVPGLALLALAAGLVSAAILPYNAHLTGSPLEFPIMAYNDALYGPRSNALGFGPERGLGWGGLDPYPGHGLRDVVVNSLLNGVAVNVELFGWATGSLLAALTFVVFGRWRRPDLLMAGAVLAVVGIHAFYWFAGGPDFGARYWFLAIVPLVALSVRGLSVAGGDAGGGRLAAGALALTVAATLCFVPWRAVDKYREYRGMRPDVRELAESESFGRSLVLVRGERHPDYASAAVYNPLDLRGAEGPIYAWDRGADVRRALREAFPDRPVYVIEGPSLTGGEYRVVERPAGRAPDRDAGRGGR